MADEIAVAPGMQPAIEAAHVPAEQRPIDRRVVVISIMAVAIGIVAGFCARVLGDLINFLSNLSLFRPLSIAPASPLGNQLGAWVIAVPVIGGIAVGLLARYGSEGIRGHGIPEAMERVLTSESRVPMRLTFLKPFSAAVAIGTGRAVGSEGPMLATR